MTSEQRREISKNMVNENHWDHIFSNCLNLKTLSLSYSSLNNNGFSKVQHTSLENLNIINTGMNLPYLSRMSKNLPALKNLDIMNPIFSMKPAKPPPSFFSIHYIHYICQAAHWIAFQFLLIKKALQKRHLKKLCLKVESNSKLTFFKTEDFSELHGTNSTYFNTSSKEADVMALDIVCKQLNEFSLKGVAGVELRKKL